MSRILWVSIRMGAVPHLQRNGMKSKVEFNVESG